MSTSVHTVPASDSVPRAGTASAAVVKAMIEVKKKITSIAKEGVNKVDKYEYIRAIDVIAALQVAESEAGLVVAPRVVDWRIENKVLATTYTFDVYHDSGEVIYNMVSHIGSCRFEFKSGTTDDKAFAKALTGCCKSAYLHLYKIPSEDAIFDDPDQQGLDDREPSRRDTRNDRRDDRRDDRRGERERDRGDRGRDSGRDRGDDDHRPRDTRGNGQWRDAPPAGGPDDYGAGEGEERRRPDPPQSEEEEERNFREDCQRLRDDLGKARDENEAAQLWIKQGDLINQMGDITYQHFREDYHSRWNVQPPSV